MCDKIEKALEIFLIFLNHSNTFRTVLGTLHVLKCSSFQSSDV